MQAVCGDIKNAGLLDFVSAWYIKAARYMGFGRSEDSSRTALSRSVTAPTNQCAFVSTNSITQGEQVGVLWGWMLSLGIKIHFAHRTFSWSNEARDKAAVHCVIISFGLQETQDKIIYEYDDIKGEPHAVKAKNINPYLVDALDVIIEKSRRPICAVPEMTYGSKPADGGNLILTEAERAELLARIDAVRKMRLASKKVPTQE